MLTLCHYDDGKEKSESHECLFREFDKSKQWAAITLNRPITELTGYGKNKEDALRARLQGEAKYYGLDAPQRHLFKQYGIEVDE